MPTSISQRGSAIRLLLIVLVVGGAAAGVYFFQRNSTLQAGVDRMKLYDDALQWRLAFKQSLPKGPPDAYTRLQISVRRDDSDAGDHSIEITGSVEDQAALDTLNAKLAGNKPPARHTFDVKVVATPPLPADVQEQINKQVKEAAEAEAAERAAQPKPQAPKN